VDKARLEQEAATLREQIRWHEEREDNPPPPYNVVAWAQCLRYIPFGHLAVDRGLRQIVVRNMLSPLTIEEQGGGSRGDQGAARCGIHRSATAICF
jgi:hypothetical protein